jgi:hypothetical protein
LAFRRQPEGLFIFSFLMHIPAPPEASKAPRTGPAYLLHRQIWQYCPLSVSFQILPSLLQVCGNCRLDFCACTFFPYFLSFLRSRSRFPFCSSSCRHRLRNLFSIIPFQLLRTPGYLYCIIAVRAIFPFLKPGIPGIIKHQDRIQIFMLGK